MRISDCKVCKLKNNLCLYLSASLVSLFLLSSISYAQVTGFNNGLSNTAVGYGQADVGSGGYYRNMQIVPVGQSARKRVAYEIGMAYSVSGGAWAILPNTAGVTPTVSGSQLTSSGSLMGANGAVNWTATSQWAGASLQTSYLFNAAPGTSFGNLRLCYYLDNDISNSTSGGSSNDLLVVSGSTAGSNLNLRTFDQTVNWGVGSTPDLAATNLTFSGWSAGVYSGDLNSATAGRLNDATAGGLQTFTAAGSVSGLTSQSDARFSGLSNYGYQDVIIGMFYTFNSGASASNASVLASTNGLLSLASSTAPEPGTLALGVLGIAGLALGRRHK
jgi:hypothetical protein